MKSDKTDEILDTVIPPGHAALLQQAAAFHEKGELEQAEAIYRQVLAEDPKNADALHLLGMLAHGLGFDEEAVELVESAVSFEPRETVFLNNLGLIYKEIGEPDKAVKAYRRSLKIDGNDPDILNDLGNLLRETKKLKEARNFLNAAVRLEPDKAIFHVNLGNVLRDQEHLDQAVECYDHALEIDPEFAGALSNLGIVAQMRDDLDEAISFFERALEIEPHDSKARNNLASVFLSKRYFEEAVTHFEKAAEGDPENALIQYNMARAMYYHGQYLESLDPLQRAMRLDPKDTRPFITFASVLRKLEENEKAAAFLEDLLEADPEGLKTLDAKANLGCIYIELYKIDKAIEILEGALEIDPKHALSLGNYGYALGEQGNHDGAMENFRRAIELEPEHSYSHHNFSLFLLSSGHLREGWEEYEWRRKIDVPESPLRAFPQPLWDGSSLDGKRIILWGEQGIGDEIRFAGMIPDLLEAWGDEAAAVDIECNKRLVDLFTRSFEGVTAHPVPYTAAERGEVDYDFQCPTGSLGRFFRPTVDSFPETASYLKPDPARAAFWKERLDALGPRPKVGLCWRSISMVNSQLPHYATIEDLAPVLSLPGLDFVNLMYAECAEERQEAKRLYGVDIHTWDDIDLRTDQNGVAALSSNLDLVVSQPSAVSELAGALGVPVLIFYTGNYYYMHGTETDVWHPNSQCFGKDFHKPWRAAFEDMARVMRQKFGLDA